MNIPPHALQDQASRALADWGPAIHAAEVGHNLPLFLLLAVGSRETNLTDEVGDGGHGHGVWQLDDRSHTIPDPFPVGDQAEAAAVILADNFGRFGDWTPAVAAYNAGSGAVSKALRNGQPADSATTGHDYAADVLGRRQWLVDNLPHWPTTPTGDDVQPTDKVRQLPNPAGAGFYQLQADGGIITRDGAPWPPPPYWAMRSDGAVYHFPFFPSSPTPSAAVWNYVGLRADDKEGDAGTHMADFGFERQ